MRQVKFHNKSVPINRCQIGVVVSNIEGNFWGHIVGFGNENTVEIKWAGYGTVYIEEDPEDLIIWE